MAPPRKSIVGRLLERHVVSDGGCWLWTAGKDRDGYGVMGIGRNRQVRAHRASYEAFKGAVNGMFVCHSCDEPSCINPDHLFLGTALDNARDRSKKGRSSIRRGEQHHGAKLNAEKVMLIRGSNKTRSELARELGMSINAISMVALRKSWRHIC